MSSDHNIQPLTDSKAGGPDDSPFLQFYNNNEHGNRLDKWSNYFEIYHRHFNRFRGKSPKILEIGVAHGGSLKMWKAYFGSKAQIVGLDTDARCKALEEPGIAICIGDQSNRGILSNLISEFGAFDIVIDDGSHHMSQVRRSFDYLFPLISPDGIYLVEDMHTAYRKEYGGGYRNPKSFIEFSKNLIDQLNAWHSQDRDTLDVNQFTKSTYSISFYDSIIIFEKRQMSQATRCTRGIHAF